MQKTCLKVANIKIWNTKYTTTISKLVIIDTCHYCKIIVEIFVENIAKIDYDIIAENISEMIADTVA